MRLTWLQVCLAWQCRLEPFLRRADRFQPEYRSLVDEPKIVERTFPSDADDSKKSTVPFESVTNLQINGTSLFNWIVDAPNLNQIMEIGSIRDDDKNESDVPFFLFSPIIDNLS